jgi:chemotaxis regulatin CheY-phosphate phosphatase CheZ
MSQLEEATKRLQAALDRLEYAVESGAGANDAVLRQALDQARSENEALQDVADTVADRLDATIDRLKSNLEA